MSVNSGDLGQVKAASVAGQLEGSLREHHGNRGSHIVACHNNHEVVEGSGVDGVTVVNRGGMNDVDMVFVSLEDNGENRRA